MNDDMIEALFNLLFLWLASLGFGMWQNSAGAGVFVFFGTVAARAVFVRRRA